MDKRTRLFSRAIMLAACSPALYRSLIEPRALQQELMGGSSHSNLAGADDGEPWFRSMVSELDLRSARRNAASAPEPVRVPLPWHKGLLHPLPPHREIRRHV